MWTARIQPEAGGRVLNVGIEQGSAPLPFSGALRLWREDQGFQTFFLKLLADAPFPAYRWETPPITAATAHRPFEFVLLDAPGLARRPDPEAFAEHFGSPDTDREALAFPNLGRDAILVVPRPIAPPSAYGHLAAFVRVAPESQKHALWKLVGETMERRVGPSPVWLSTAGAGVSWLHVRLDDRPKYYGYDPYRASNSRDPSRSRPPNT
jgi:hypothetical protein